MEFSAGDLAQRVILVKIDRSAQAAQAFLLTTEDVIGIIREIVFWVILSMAIPERFPAPVVAH
jgi:hypothetical protein